MLDCVPAPCESITADVTADVTGTAVTGNDEPAGAPKALLASDRENRAVWIDRCY